MIAHTFIYGSKRHVHGRKFPKRRAPLTRLVRHLSRTSGRPSSRMLGVGKRRFASGDDEGHLKVSQRRRRDTPPVQPCATTRVAVTSESLLLAKIIQVRLRDRLLDRYTTASIGVLSRNASKQTAVACNWRQ